MLRNNRFHSFAECLDGRHPFDAEEAQQNLWTSTLNDPERKGLLELLTERIAQLPEAPKKVLAMYYLVVDFVFENSNNESINIIRHSSVPRFFVTNLANLRFGQIETSSNVG
jgi:hypothetical protein